MTPAEAGMLLAIAAAFDNRKPDPDAAKAWALALDGHRFEDCRDAIVAYYRKSRDWIMPSDVIEGVKAIRWDRIVAFDRIAPDHLVPPAHFRDDVEAEMAWRRDIRNRVANGEITHPDQLDDDRGELMPHDVESLGQIGRRVPRA